jgi:hypothetical protein
MESKFYTLINEFYNRNNIGGFLRGDHVSIADGWEQMVKDLDYPEDMRNIITRLANTKNRLVITDVFRDSNASIGNPQAATFPSNAIISVAEEISPGLPIDPIPLPIKVLKRINNGHNLGEIPAAWKHPVTISNGRPLTDDDVIDTFKDPDYTKYKDLAKQHILDRQVDDHKPEKKGVDMTGQAG